MFVGNRIRSFLTYRKLRKNRPREQDFDVWRTSAEVKAGSARFFIPFFMNENNPAAGAETERKQKSYFPSKRGRIAFSANERITEIPVYAIQAALCQSADSAAGRQDAQLRQ